MNTLNVLSRVMIVHFTDLGNEAHRVSEGLSVAHEMQPYLRTHNTYIAMHLCDTVLLVQDLTPSTKANKRLTHISHLELLCGSSELYFE